MRLKVLTRIVASLAVALVYAGSLRAAEPSAVGLWQQADENGEVSGWFLFFEHDGVYEGAIVKMFLKPDEDQNPICTKCPGDQKNAPSVGLTIIRGMQRKGLIYENGTILDPRTGWVYHAKMEVSPDGQQLTVRGYLGIALFGQNQVWKRLPDNALPPDQMPANLLQFLATVPKQPDKIMTKGGGPTLKR